MQQPMSPFDADRTGNPMSTSTSALIAKRRRKPGKCVADAAVSVAEPGHLCQVQATTRALCRSVDLDESSVFHAVIAVSELAHRLFIERARCGNIELAAIRRHRRLRLEICAKRAGAQDSAAVRVSLEFPLASGAPYS